jgi:hypothetical protein
MTLGAVFLARTTETKNGRKRQRGRSLDTTIPEPTLTFRLSDRNEFHCSACGHEIASAHNSRFIVDCVVI